jgi:hypothetical protein
MANFMAISQPNRNHTVEKFNQIKLIVEESFAEQYEGPIEAKQKTLTIKATRSRSILLHGSSSLEEGKGTYHHRLLPEPVLKH